MFLEPSVVHFDALPVAARQRLVGSLGGATSPPPTLFAATEARVGAGTFAVLLVAGLVIGAAGRLSAGAGLVALMAATVVATVTLALMVRGWLLRRWLPWPAGRYLLGSYLIDASSEVLRVESALAIEGTDVVHHHRDGDHVITTIAFRTRGHVYRFSTARREDARLALDHLEADLIALIDAVRYGEIETVARLDPLFEARMMDPLPATAPAGRPADRPRLGLAPWSTRAVIVLATASGALAGARLWGSRWHEVARAREVGVPNWQRDGGAVDHVVAGDGAARRQ